MTKRGNDMSKFESGLRSPGVSTPIKTEGRIPSGRTYEGAPAYGYTAKTELFTTAVANFVSERAFYESASDRDERYASLIHAVVDEDPKWVARFVPWLRNEGNMRSVSIVTACEYVASGGPNGRRVVDSACSRADEPGEVISYWFGTRGRPKLPAAIKRGVADAARRLYNERSALKYDASGSSMRFGDVIRLAHVQPSNDRQSMLFKWLIDRSYGNDPVWSELPDELFTVKMRGELQSLPVEKRREALRTDHFEDRLRSAGMTWESLAGWLQGPMDAQAWEAVIPSMGYMALLRNLRNFDEAHVSDKVAYQVASKLSDPEEVANSRQFPFRFLSAYRSVSSDRWSHALSQAFDLSLQNIPAFDGRTLVLVDTSGSMSSPMSARSTVTCAEAGGVLGIALAQRNAGNVDLAHFGTTVQPIEVKHGGSALKAVENFTHLIGRAGHGTDIGNAIRHTYKGQDRVVLVSDMQSHTSAVVPEGTFFHGYNLGGYTHTPFQVGVGKSFGYAGLTDKAFTMMPMVERGQSQDWPF